MAYLQLIETYKKKGYEIKTRRTTKLAKWAYLVKEKTWSFSKDEAYLYFVDGNVTLGHMNDFLKRYSNIYDDKRFGGEDHGMLVYLGNLNTRDFRALAKNTLSNKQYKSMKLKKVKPVSQKQEVKSRDKKKSLEVTKSIAKKDIKDANRLRNHLKKFSPIIPKRSQIKERDIEVQMVQSLQSKFGNDKVNYQERSRSGRADIVVSDNYAIELKVINTPSQLTTILGQVIVYSKEYDKVYLWMYDPKRRLKTVDVNKFKKTLVESNVNNVEIIHKN